MTDIDGDDAVDIDVDDVVIQPRCVFCGHEHYVLAVIAISYANASCGRCGRVPPIFLDENAYRARLQEVYG